MVRTEGFTSSLYRTGVADMTLERQKRVSRAACAAAAEDTELAQYLQLGVSFEGTKPTKNMKGELLEAVLGAVYQDSGFRLRPVQEFYEQRVAPSGAVSRAVA